jgi:hypothetical protein
MNNYQISAASAIKFALEVDSRKGDGEGEGMDFLQHWFDGKFDTLRKSWPHAPESVFPSNAIENIPTVILGIEGGALHWALSNSGVSLIVLDGDIEGGDAENIYEINGDDVYVSEWELNRISKTGEDGINPEFVNDVIEQIEKKRKD